MKSLNIVLTDEIHRMLTELKETYGSANFNEAIAEAIKREYQRKEAPRHE